MDWYQVVLTATAVVAIQAEDQEDAESVAWQTVRAGDFEIDESSVKGPIAGGDADRLKRHANKVIPA